MSGPIVRKYGFPNFDAIFGSREIQHGAPADPPEDPKPADDDPKPAERADPGSPPGADATEEEKQSEDSAQL